MKACGQLLLVVALAGCGGGGSGNDDATGRTPSGGGTLPSPAPFGLTARPPLAELDIPLDDGTLGAYRLEDAFPGLRFPGAVFLTAVPGEPRLVAVQQSGQLRAFDPGSGAAVSELLLDLAPRLDSRGERGLLGLAFDPDFFLNRYLYVYQSLANSGGPGVDHVSRISRFTWPDPGRAVDPASEKVILEVDQPFSNHNGGALAFGPDGFLHVALGDGGSGGDPLNNAQNPGNLLGSILRIDVHPDDPAAPYAVPADNPFSGRSGFRQEIFAFGLRNPFRMSFDRATGTLWAGDVGQSAREEIDVVVAGGNYGWRVFEGTLAFDNPQNLPASDFSAPVLDYGRGDGGAVIGGYVYRGSRVPSLQGRYLYGDFVSGNVWALSFDARTHSVLDNTLIGNVSGVTSFGETADGDVLVVTGGGTVFRIDETASGTPSQPPPLLSQTGVFSDLAALSPASGFIEYAVNVPFWSDGAVKRRWLAVPDASRIDFQASGSWSFPVGTVLVKHFELLLVEGDPSSRRRLETRLLVHRASGWEGYTYRWNENGTDADLMSARQQAIFTVALAGGGIRQQRYEFPSRTDCMTCHTEAGGTVLGVRTSQLNRAFDYPAATDNQLRSLNRIGLFRSDIGAGTDVGDGGAFERLPDIDDDSVPVELRARAYLDVNCAHCHQPGGGSPVAMDLRLETVTADMNIMDAVPEAGDLGIAEARIVAPGDAGRSVLLARMRTLDGNRMPPLASHVVDESGAELVEAWINGL